MSQSTPTTTGLPADHPLHRGAADSPLIRAARRIPGPRPVWFMRQAGRSLPEYRRIREGTAMLQACFDPSLVAEITLQPVRRHGVDAAILFSDIVVPLRAVGVDLDIVPGVGPVVARPVRTAADVARIGPLDPAAVAAVAEVYTAAWMKDEPVNEAVRRAFYLTRDGAAKRISKARAAGLLEGIGPNR